MKEIQRVIALGFFDGVHRGHGALLDRVACVAEERGCVPAAVTFDHHPKEIIPGAEKVALINTPADREWLMCRYHRIGEVIVLPFDEKMREMGWREFVTELLVKKYGAVHLVAGHDFHFGRRGEGDPARLQAICAQLGLGCDIIGKVELDGITVSSTHIRALMEQGDMEGAARYLDHPHVLSGQVVRGKQLGRTLGIPTANLLIPEGVIAPAFGVYACRVWVGEKSYCAVTNVGVRPTVDDGDRVTVEPWILDFDGDLYGRTIRVEFHKYLRGERKFSSLEELRAAIVRNGVETKAYFA